MKPTLPATAAARETVRDLVPSRIREVANAAMGRGDVLPFWFGESDQPTPRFIRDAAAASITAGETFYTENLGRPWLRQAIAGYLSDLHDKAIDAGRVAVSGSGVSALMLASQLVVEPGDHVVAVTPLWPNIVEIPRILGARVTRVGLVVRDGRWSLDLDALLDALVPGTRMLVLNSPNNPTGWTLAAAERAPILEHCRRHGIWILADDVYERLVFDPYRRSAPSFLPLVEDGERVISTNSFSKAWTMTGWRVGWITAPSALADDLAKLIEYNTSCVAEPVQRAALAAIRDGEAEVARMRTRLLETRRLIVAGLGRLPGVELPEAGGAMYAFFRIAGYPDSLALAKRLVAEAGLGLAPGVAFGPEGEGWLRWCHAVEPARLDDGLTRLGRFLAATTRQAATG